MTDDDVPRGRLLTRRDAVLLMGLSGMAGSSLSAAATRCVVQAEQTEGPYFVENTPNRSDVRNGKPGAPLRIVFNVAQVKPGGQCSPLPDARVDVWHCDALGVYSDTRDRRGDTVGQKFLRGYQTTDAQGAARFVTVYPGWYPGRTVHVHFKVRAQGGQEFTSQLYFDDALTDRVHRTEAYASNGRRTLKNDRDWIFRDGGSQLTLALAENKDAYEGAIDIAMQMS